MSSGRPLEGKRALVTGASRGIGRAVALRLARQGARVAINYNVSHEGAAQVAEEVRALGSEAIVVQADVSEAAAVAGMFHTIEQAWRGVDILVNNAGIIRDSLLLRMSDEAWNSVLDTNLKGPFLCTRAALRTMVRQRWGRVINISSVIGQVGNAGQANYAASKAGLNAFTRSVAREVASRNVTVNAIAPGYIATEIVDVLKEQMKKLILARIPLERFGSPDDVASAVAYLASEDASYVTGQVLTVDGGMAP